MSNALLLSNDLFFGSRIQSAARSANVQLKISKSIADVAKDQAFGMVILDLFSCKDDPADVAESLRERSQHMIAFGPHVQTDSIQAARNVGFDRVMTRGEFDRDISQLFKTPDAQ